MGAWLVASANLILVAAILVFGNDGLSPIWPFLYFAMMGFSFLFLLAGDAGAGLARRARAGERDDDGRGVPDAVRGEQHHGPPRRTL